jgi:hypothetical protein
MKFWPILLLAVACQAGLDEPRQMAVTCTKQACTDVDAAALKGSYVTSTRLTCCQHLQNVAIAALISAAGCGPLPGPVNPAPGAAGAPSVDGRAACIANTKASDIRKQQAADNGISINTLADDLCSSTEVQACFASGVCQ